MNRGAAPLTLAHTRPVPKISMPFQQELQQTKGPLWRRVMRRPDPSPPPPQKPKPDYDHTWKAGLTRRLRFEPKPEPKTKPKPEPDVVTLKSQPEPKPEKKWEPDWMRKQQEVERKPEPEKKPDSIWKPKQEPAVRQEQERKPELVKKPEPEKKTEPLWKRKPEQVKPEPERKPEPEKKPETLWKRQQEPTKIHQEQERKRESERKREPERKLEPERQLEQENKSETYWKRKQEPIKDPEPERKPEQPLWKRKQAERERRPEPEPRPEPLWKRKVEPVPKPEPERKPEPEKRTEPLWKRKPEVNKIESITKPDLLKHTAELTKKFEPEKKPETNWKRKQDLRTIEAEKKALEPTKRPEPLWKWKQEQEKQEAEKQRTEALQSNRPDQDDSDSESESDLQCPLCSEVYDGEEGNQQPVLLPRCGHIFCRACLIKGKNKGHFPCPTCRKRHLKPTVEELPVQAELLTRAEAFRDEKLGRCEKHGEVMGYWCRECDYALCGQCKILRGHNLLKMRILLKEKRQEMTQQAQDILESVDQEKQKILDSVKTCSAQLLKVCEASTVAEDSAQDVKSMLSDTKQTADLQFLLGSLKRMKSILGSLARSGSTNTSDAEAEKGSETPKVRRRRERRVQSQDTASTRSQSSENKLSRTVHVEGNKTKVPPVSGQDNKPKSLKPDINHKVSATPQPSPYSQNVGIAGMTGEQRARVSSEGPLKGLGDASLWPLTCCVYADDGKKARLAWEGGKLHMWALRDMDDDAHFMIKLSVLQSVIPQDNPEVFLDLGVGELRLGRIYIRLWGHLRRAHHFLALCMGTHGPSYRGAKFEEVYSRGLKGECLHAGPYLTPEGNLSAQGVMDMLEWDGRHKSIQRMGLVVGAGSGRPDRESCFDICTMENQNRNFACPFGEVVGGWDVVLAARDHRPIRAVTMVDVGVVVPDLTTSALTASLK